MKFYVSHIVGYDNIAKIDLIGEMNSSTWPEMEQKLSEQVKQSTQKFFLYDFHKTSFLNSTVIGFFINLMREAEKTRKQILFVDLHPNIAEIFQLVGMEKVVKIFPDTIEAVESITNYK
ncbi:STAS domain-containing protein [Candidatus Peregrinibacteria bacterium]|nr:STAS domain-containing protein [Candidatus Peregrinibacteria bacterium]